MLVKSCILLLCTATVAFALDPPIEEYTKKRLIVTTDIGGSDKDDTQSMIHLLFYADFFDIKGIVIGRPGGRRREMRRVLRAYRKDYPKLALHSDYITPGQIQKLIKQGAKGRDKTGPAGYSSSTPGSRLIVREARKEDPRPLHVTCWGSATDVAQAIHDAPDIVSKLRLFCGDAQFNYNGDPSPTKFLNTKRNLRWVGGYGSGRGLYWGGLWSKEKYGNIGFVDQVLAPSGAMGRLYKRVSKFIDVNRGGIKMGDSVSILFVMKGSFDRPRKRSWGGRYCKVRPNRFKECFGDDLGGRPGGAAVAPYRIKILKDWEKRIKRLSIF